MKHYALNFLAFFSLNAFALDEAVIRKNLDFYVAKAWNETNGTFNSHENPFELPVVDQKVTLKTAASHVTAFYRAASLFKSEKYRLLASKQLAFMKQHFLKVDAKGWPLAFALQDDSDSSASSVEQAQFLTALVAFFEANPTAQVFDGEIFRYFSAFYHRYHDQVQGGLLDFESGEVPAGAAPKSLAGNLLPALGFLLDLERILSLPRKHSELEEASLRCVRKLLYEIAAGLANQGVNPLRQWVNSEFQADWQDFLPMDRLQKVDFGHQLAAVRFLLLMASNQRVIQDKNMRLALRDQAFTLLRWLMAKPNFDRMHGGVFASAEGDSVAAGKVASEQIEALMMLQMAAKILTKYDRVRYPEAIRRKEQIEAFYLAHFIDGKDGGEWSELAREGKVLPKSQKILNGKTALSLVELARVQRLYRLEPN